MSGPDAALAESWAAARRASARDPVLVALAVLTVAVGAGYGVGLGSRIVQVVGCWLLLGAVHLCVAVIAWRVAGVPELPGPVRRFWRTVALTGALYTAGDAIQFVTIARAPSSMAAALGGLLQSLCVLAGTLLLVGVLLSLPVGIRSGPERWRFWLDVATVMVAAATLGAYSTTLLMSGEGLAARVIDAVLQLMLGPALFLVGVFAVVKLLLSAQPPFTRAAGAGCAAAAGIEAATQALSGLMVGGGRVRWVLGLTLIASVALAAAARIQQLQIRADPGTLARRRIRPYSALPYAAIGATYLLLVVVLAGAGLNGHAWLVVIGALTGTGLVVVRQLAAFADNARLLRELEASLRERDQLAEQLHHLAYHDDLTGLANRALFLQRLEEASGATSSPPTQVVVMLIDLDDFKPVNDAYGHAAGDRVLRETATRLRGCVRDGDMVARLGGDEFAVLIEHRTGRGGADLAERILRAIEAPVSVGDIQVSITASVGVAVCQSGGLAASEILNQADLAMYTAKARGKGAHEIRWSAAAGASPGASSVR